MLETELTLNRHDCYITYKQSNHMTAFPLHLFDPKCLSGNLVNNGVIFDDKYLYEPYVKRIIDFLMISVIFVSIDILS